MAEGESKSPGVRLRHAGPTLARLAEGSAPGRLRVQLADGSEHTAITTVKLDAAAIRAALADDQPVVLLFQDDDPTRPIIVGLVQVESATPLLDELLDGAPVAAELPRPAAAMPALVDGKQVVIDAKDELVLRCGKATITLRRNGKVIIRGTYVETHAEGTNRIKGGSVKIN